MGVGSRMKKKQGMPEPLDESLITRKRKDAPEKAAPERKKRSRIAAREAKEAKAKATPKTRVNGKPVKKAAPVPTLDEISSEDEIDNDDDDVMGDINVTGLDALGSASEVDEDEFDSDIIDDSDTEVRKAMWSDDEDEDEVEEQLTAASEYTQS
jgi:ribosomal RNA methyltransferase Nop2